MTPSWDDAPEWANFLAQDKDGDWYWFEKEPKLAEEFWDVKHYPSKFKIAQFPIARWEKSLQKRPSKG